MQDAIATTATLRSAHSQRALFLIFSTRGWAVSTRRTDSVVCTVRDKMLNQTNYENATHKRTKQEEHQHAQVF